MPHIWPPDELTPPADNNQKEAAEIFRQYGRLAIEAAPGTGKTFLGVYLSLCAYNLGWTSKDFPTLFLTFSRNARVQIELALQTFHKQGWIKPEEDKAVQVYNYHAFYFEYIKQKAGIWGCVEKLRPASIQENKSRLEALFPVQHVALAQANLVYALKRFSIGDLLFNECEPKFDKDTLGKIQTEAISMLRKGRPYYDDFAPLFLNLLELCPEFVEWIRLRYPVIILDEFQDTDIIQWNILQKINPIHPVILYDRYQMIYEWRGSRFERLESTKKVLHILPEQEKQITNIHRCDSQRSFSQFIQELRTDDLLGNFVDGQRDRPWLSKKEVILPRDRTFLPSENRCLTCLRFTRRMIDPQETTAIITRTNFFADYLFENLRIRPERGSHFLCRWIGSEDNPDEKIRDWIWQLRNIKDDNGIRVCLGGLIDVLLPYRIQQDLDVSFGIEFSKSQDLLFYRKKRDIFKNIKAYWLPKWDCFTIGNYESISTGIEMVLNTANEITSGKGYLDPDLIYYLKQIGQASKKFQPENSNPRWSDFCDYLENIHLQSSFYKIRVQTSGLYILTIHQSKGREFDHVIIPWLSGTGEPNKMMNGQKFQIKLDYTKLDDKKLLYVEVTRAKRKVTIIYPQEDPSPFLINWKMIS